MTCQSAPAPQQLQPLFHGRVEQVVVFTTSPSEAAHENAKAFQ
jgi:hypothetical protein